MRELLKWAIAVLKEQGIESPQLDAEILLAHTLGRLTRSELYARLDDEPDPEVEETFRSLVGRRSQHEPVAYITGRKEFYGLDLYVDQRVLIPRPETETLVEVSLSIARQKDIMRLAEVGVGSGAIAIALAANLRSTNIFAIDASADALAVAKLNCQRHGVLDRVRLLRGDLLEPLPEPVQLIVANLPYVSQEELEGLPPDIIEYEPLRAIDGGEDGLEHVKRLLAQAPPKLQPHGIICLEIGATQAPAVNELAREEFPDATVGLVRDLAGLDRVAIIAT
ncbi:MAG: peptide chain release factor N(5)-glutamine methyltransferase [Anaerolineae bacterium]|nr:peptide chain release factor N(5)-glutamine methyltransferase [Anaerolineae bacterium]NIN93871.1 peptide chain release factor N(5)-glutamine methyltransferase [Anaerolineae bacterium]NIQ76904.1 peptide chain release factor N(5)-glutamine methyltransferase [Anaerolineae bacterium]